MIRKQYRSSESDLYFSKFVKEKDWDYTQIKEELKKYNATLGKSKNKNYMLNVKWHDPKLYALFVMRWS